jgi:hypothetical protein
LVHGGIFVERDEMSESEMYARLQYLYVYICTMALGTYTPEAEGAVAEYFEIRRLLFDL